MKPAPFDYDRPTDIEAVLTILAEDGDARILAGGQSLLPMMNFRIAQPSRLIDINRIPGLDYIRDAGGHIAIGALARHNSVKSANLIGEHAPLVAAAYDWIAHHAVRNRGTLCGNLCHADPASEMPAVMQVLNAEMVVRSAKAQRAIPATAFFTSIYETALAPSEMLVEVRIPKAEPGTGWGFEEVSMRRGDFAWATVAATLRLSAGRLVDVRIALAGVGERALRVGTAETALNGQKPGDALFAQVANAAASAINPPETVSVSADYRRDLVRALLPRVLKAAVARAQ
jgi:aerobic carbon-monoxide dehydrogenase medium subunit